MSDFVIGSWIKRGHGKWHVVETDVADAAVTKCGRRMDRVTRSGGELQVSAVMPLTRLIGQPQLCKAGCERADPHPRPIFEDDASTAPTDPTMDTP